MSRISPKRSASALGVALALAFPFVNFGYLPDLPNAVETGHYRVCHPETAIELLPGVAAAAICEEFIYRGFLIEELGEFFHDRRLAGAISIIFFGLAHGNSDYGPADLEGQRGSPRVSSESVVSHVTSRGDCLRVSRRESAHSHDSGANITRLCARNVTSEGRRRDRRASHGAPECNRRRPTPGQAARQLPRTSLDRVRRRQTAASP
jgi:hypothetical protein